MEFKADIYAKKFIAQKLGERPLVFWDTCAMLDILRVADKTRSPKLGIEALEAYEKIVQLIEAGRLVSVTSYMVRHEFNDNFENAHNSLIKTEKRCVGDILEYAGYAENQNAYHSVKVATDLIDAKNRIIGLLERLCKNTFVLKEQKFIYEKIDVSKQARERILHKIAPASRKQEYKDCYIWLTFVSLAKNIHQHKKTIFFTSNKADYMEEASSIPLERLNKDIAELENVEIKFYANDVNNRFESALGECEGAVE